MIARLIVIYFIAPMVALALVVGGFAIFAKILDVLNIKWPRRKRKDT